MSDAREALVALILERFRAAETYMDLPRQAGLLADAIQAAGWTPPGERVKLRAELERLRGVERGWQHDRAEWERERDEARQQLADLRAGIEALRQRWRGEVLTGHGARREGLRKALDDLAALAVSGEQPGERERAWLNADPRKAVENLRAVVGASEQPGEVYGPRPTACCGKCPPIEGGGYDCTCEGNPRCVRERVWQALRESRRNGLGGMTEAQALDHMTDAVLAVVRPSGQEGS